MAEKVKPVVTESTYTVAEYVAASGRLFGCSPDIVAAALKGAGKKSYTKDEAKAIVKKFKERKIS